MASELAQLESRQFLNIAQSLLPFATDTSLDLLGEIFGVPGWRRPRLPWIWEIRTLPGMCA